MGEPVAEPRQSNAALMPHRHWCGYDWHEPDNDADCADPECPGRSEPIKGHAVCTCCLERTHPPDEPPTIVLGSPATYGVIHECSKCGTLCTLPGCYGRV